MADAPVVMRAPGGSARGEQAWRRAPWLLFLAVAALALISPTSSIAPLAEMVNEHRPYLPFAILSLVLIVPGGVRLATMTHRPSRALALVSVAILFVALTGMTWRRNEVFSTELRYWKDVLDKAPSSRAHMNYGLALMRSGDAQGSIAQYRASLAISPYWYFTFINLGVAHNHLGQADSARAAFDRAVQYDSFSGLVLTWRGEFLLGQRDYRGALQDFEQSQRVALHRYRNAKGIAAAYAGLGDAGQCLESTTEMQRIDAAVAARDLQTLSCTAVVQASAQDQERAMARGLEALARNDNAGAERIFRDLLAMNAGPCGAHYQLAVALDRQGKTAEPRGLWETVLRMAEGYSYQATITAARKRLRK